MVKNPPANARDADSIPGLGRFPWIRKWQSTPVFFLGNPMKSRACWGTVPGVTKKADMPQQLNKNNNNNITHIFNVFMWICINIYMCIVYIARQWAYTV